MVKKKGTFKMSSTSVSKFAHVLCMLTKLSYKLTWGFFPPFVHVDKEGGMLNVHACQLEGEGAGCQNWVKFGPRSC